MADQPIIDPTGNPDAPQMVSGKLAKSGEFRLRGGDDPFKVIQSSIGAWYCMYSCTGDGVPPYNARMAHSGKISDEANHLFGTGHPVGHPATVANKIDVTKYNKIVITPTDRFWRPIDSLSPRVYVRKSPDELFTEATIPQA